MSDTMMHHQMSSSDGVEISSDKLVGRKNSVMPSQDVIRDTADHDDHAEQRDDDEPVTSSANSSKIAQRRGSFVPEAEREAKPKRHHVFDDMHDYFCNRRVDPAVKFHSSLAPPSHGEMYFGDLDFDADAAAFGFAETDSTLNDQRAALPMHSHFCNQRIDPAASLHSSIALPGNNEMCFGDLDFDADAAALGFGFEESVPTPVRDSDLMSRPKEDCTLRMEQSTNDESVHDAQIKREMEECAIGTGR
eukprot:scaffold21788_cov109-Skeletonema_dohrnii-CCMP3373.AAC.3